MEIGVVSYPAELASSLPVIDLGMEVHWLEAPVKVQEAMAADPVQALLIPIDVASSDHIVAILRGARVAIPNMRILLLCCTSGEARVLAEICDVFPPVSPALPPALPETAGRPSQQLSPRQSRVLENIKAGMTNREIALALGVSQSTINRHVEHILRKLGVRNRAQAAALPLEITRDQLPPSPVARSVPRKGCRCTTLG